MSDKTSPFGRRAYSWGGRFHLATFVPSEYGVSMLTLCGQSHNPETVKAMLPWGNVPNALACRDCLAHENDEPTTKPTVSAEITEEAIEGGAQKLLDKVKI